jgi:hypothetical protein
MKLGLLFSKKFHKIILPTRDFFKKLKKIVTFCSQAPSLYAGMKAHHLGVKLIGTLANRSRQASKAKGEKWKIIWLLQKKLQPKLRHPPVLLYAISHVL